MSDNDKPNGKRPRPNSGSSQNRSRDPVIKPSGRDNGRGGMIGNSSGGVAGERPGRPDTGSGTKRTKE